MENKIVSARKPVQKTKKCRSNAQDCKTRSLEILTLKKSKQDR
ncbi:hypothetical protein Q1M15_05260 [Mammaliicoccus sciuri]|nr:hypothetical protein [Mammaliicoccus sciuri]